MIAKNNLFIQHNKESTDYCLDTENFNRMKNEAHTAYDAAKIADEYVNYLKTK